MAILNILALVVFASGLWFLFLHKPVQYPDDDVTAPTLVFTSVAGAWLYAHIFTAWDSRTFLAIWVIMIAVLLFGIIARSMYLKKKSN